MASLYLQCHVSRDCVFDISFVHLHAFASTSHSSRPYKIKLAIGYFHHLCGIGIVCRVRELRYAPPSAARKYARQTRPITVEAKELVR